MGRLTVLLSLVLLCFVAVGARVLLRSRAGRIGLTKVQLDAVQSVSPSLPREVVLLPEPRPPETGTAGRKVFLKAVIEGDERSLVSIRKALSASALRRPGRPADSQLLSLERAYSERLERHEREALTTGE
jgi:hypothetical protein